MLSFKRLGLLLRKHWIENYRIYLMGMGVITGFTILIFLFVFYIENGGIETAFQIGYFVAGLFLCGTIFSSYIFNDFSQRAKGILFLTLPGSSLEKFLSLWLFSTIGFLIMYIVVFYAVSIPFVKIGQYYFSVKPRENQLLNIFSSKDKFYYIFFLYFPLQAIFFLGGIGFEKFSFIKTAVSVFLIGAVFILLNYLIVKIMLGENSVNNTFPFISMGHSYITAHLPDEISDVVGFIFKYCVTPFLWFVTYLKVAEKEL